MDGAFEAIKMVRTSVLGHRETFVIVVATDFTGHHVYTLFSNEDFVRSLANRRWLRNLPRIGL